MRLRNALPLQQGGSFAPQGARPRGLRLHQSIRRAPRNSHLAGRRRNKIYRQICEPRLSMVNTARGGVFHLTSLLHFLPSLLPDAGLGFPHPPWSPFLEHLPSQLPCTLFYCQDSSLCTRDDVNLAGHMKDKTWPAASHGAAGHGIGDVQYRNFHKSPEFHYVMQSVL